MWMAISVYGNSLENDPSTWEHFTGLSPLLCLLLKTISSQKNRHSFLLVPSCTGHLQIPSLLSYVALLSVSAFLHAISNKSRLLTLPLVSLEKSFLNVGKLGSSQAHSGKEFFPQNSNFHSEAQILSFATNVSCFLYLTAHLVHLLRKCLPDTPV